MAPRIFRSGEVAVTLGDDPDEPIALHDESCAPWPYCTTWAALSVEQAQDLHVALGEAMASLGADLAGN